MRAETPSAEQVKAAIEAAVPGCRVQVLPNGSPSGQQSLILDHEHAVEVARFLRDDATLRLDYCSNVTGVDWLDTEISEKVKVKKLVDGAETEVEEVRKTKVPGYLEAVYHLYSIEKKHGPVILRMRTGNRADGCPPAVADAGVAERGVPGAGDFRPVRNCFRRAPGPAAAC